MRPAPLLVLALVLLAPLAAAQLVAVPAGRGLVEVPQPGGGTVIYPRIEGARSETSPLIQAWFLVGHDNVVNVTVGNHQNKAWNATLRVNVTGATASEDTLRFDIPPGATRSQLLSVHPDDTGKVSLSFVAEDAFQPDGTPHSALLEGPAVYAPSVAYLDPPPVVEEEGMMRQSVSAYTRIAPGDTIRPRVHLRNDLPVATAPFRLSLDGSRTVGPVDVRSLEPGETLVVELPEFTPAEGQASSGPQYYFGPMGQLELRVMGEFTIAGASARGHLASYRVERGAVVDVVPATALVIIQDGLAIDLLTPMETPLGVPTRIKVNASNLGRTDVSGTLLVMINTPSGVYYEVQGPETRSIRLDLAPGEQLTEAIEFTPRVTGAWSVSSLFRSGEGFGYGGGGSGFTVQGPTTIRFDRFGTEYARIGERVEVGITVQTTETIQDAHLRVASGAAWGRGFGQSSEAGKYRPGLTQRLLDVETTTSSLGTLRPGGALNVTLELTGRSSGRYDVIPYVLAEGFAYTSRPYDPSVDGPLPDGIYYGGYGVQIAVQPRPLPTALALLPLTIGLAVFVGTWTMRTRFVK